MDGFKFDRTATILLFVAYALLIAMVAIIATGHYDG